MPVRASAAAEAGLKEKWAKLPQAKQSFDLIPLSVAGPSIRGYQDIRDAVSEMLTKITTKKAKPEDALRDAAARANNILKENK
jgi:ABC-type glycerol-3-phosphate transport system substrate-binding protein